MKTAGLFAGIGGLELGFQAEGFETAMMAEIDDRCRKVLRSRFPGVDLRADIAQIDTLPVVDVLLAGFPCQPYSPAGPTRGFDSGRWHIDQIFRLIDSSRCKPSHVVLENVPFIVHLDSGKAMSHVLDGLEYRGYKWAYRIIDTSAFGLPQRRRRWILIASQTANPAAMLLEQDAHRDEPRRITANGFYWTEGNRGVGWANNVVPPLKGGSTLGIASPPAIWAHGSGSIVIPRIRAAERLQGFEQDWTLVDDTMGGQGARARWKMVGNAVSVPLSRWVASRLLSARDVAVNGSPLGDLEVFPRAAFFDGRSRYRSGVGVYPLAERLQPLLTFLGKQVTPLSFRATRGFRTRYEKSSLVKNPRFIKALLEHEATQAA